MISDSLGSLGWNDSRQEQFQPYAGENRYPSRVAAEYQGGLFRLFGESGEYQGRITGKFRYEARERQDLPAAGDWVVSERIERSQQVSIVAVLPRSSKFSRRAAGDATGEQIVAANIDTVFLMLGLDHDFNPRRAERYLVMAWESGANPVFVLNKADLCADLDDKLAQLEPVALGVPIHIISCASRSGLEQLLPYVQPGATAAMLGSSGVGKSSLANCLIGWEERKIAEVRQEDSHGRHTTTNRELLRLPQGGLLLDTPGMRELQLWEAESGFDHAFADLLELAGQCRFRDCRHEQEPGCAVREAIAGGRLGADRLAGYRKLQKELAYLEAKEKGLVRVVNREWAKKIRQGMQTKTE